MAEFLLMMLLLGLPAPLPAAGQVPASPVRAIDLDADMMLKSPALPASDTLALRVESGREVYYKVSERGEILASGKLLPGSNSLLVARPGLFAGSQTLFLLLDLLENETRFQNKITIAVTVEGGPQAAAGAKTALSGLFTLGMYHDGSLVGLRKKSMGDLLVLKTGPVTDVPDPGISGSAIRDRPVSQSVSVLGLGLALAKYLAGKKAAAAAKARSRALQKKELTLDFAVTDKNGALRRVRAGVTLQVD